MLTDVGNALERKQIAQDTDVKGQLLRMVIEDGGEKCVLVFDDGRFAVLAIERVYDDEHRLMLESGVDLDPYLVYRAGLMTEAEYKAEKEATRLDHEKRYESIDRKKYEELKARFESKP